MLILLFAIVWFIIGYVGFVYWSTKDTDVDLAYSLIGIFIALLGPVAWLIGWIIFGDKSGTVIFKRRNKR